LPVFIIPSSFLCKHYVVLNIGHTFQIIDLKTINTILFFHLGDYSILKVNPLMPSKLEIMVSGLFDDLWTLIEAEK